MNLRLKVLLATTLTAVISLSALGVFTISMYRTITFETLNSRLSDTLREISEIEDSELQAAFYLTSVANYPLMVGLADQEGRVTSLGDINLNVKKLPEASLTLAQQVGVEVDSSQILIRSIASPSGGFVIIGTPLSQMNSTVSQLQRNIIGAAVLLMFINALALFILTRSDYRSMRRLVTEARNIAEGRYQADISVAPGTNEIAQLSRSISEMTEALQNNAKEAQLLFGSISHELKTPLTAIRGYAELLDENEELSEKERGYVDTISMEVQRMTSLINDLLLLSRLGTLHYSLDNTFDVVPMVKDRVKVLRDLQPDREIVISGVNQCLVQGSEDLISRLIDNLIANALNHTPSGTRSEFRIQSSSSDWKLTYIDNGPGMPAEYLLEDRIEFLPFDERKSPRSSSGLGLHIVQSIVRQHGGTLSIDTPKNGGVEFRICIPYRA